MRIATSVRAAILSAALVVAGAVGPAAAAPVTIRAAWVIVPNMFFPLMTMKTAVLRQHGVGPDVLRHYGKSYVLHLVHFAGSAPEITALAAGDLDLSPLSFSAFAFAINNAHMTRLKIIADGLEDGVPGWYATPYRVLKSSPIKTIAGLKGHVLGVNTFGGAVDLSLRLMLEKAHLNPKTDVTIIEVKVPNMKSELLEGKVAMVAPLGTFAFDPQLLAASRVLFTSAQAAGPNETIFLTTPGTFIAKHRAAMVDFLADELRFFHWLSTPANHANAVDLVALFAHVPVKRLSFAFTHADSYRNPKGLPNLKALQRTLDNMVRLGFLKKKVVVARYTDLSLVREAASGKR